MARKGYLVGFVRPTQVVSGDWFFCSGKGEHLYKWIFVTFTKWNLCLAFRQKGGGQKVPPVSVSHLPSAQKNQYANFGVFGDVISWSASLYVKRDPALIVFLALLSRGSFSGTVHFLLVPGSFGDTSELFTPTVNHVSFRMHKWCTFLMVVGEGKCEKQGEEGFRGKNLEIGSLRALHVHILP